MLNKDYTGISMPSHPEPSLDAGLAALKQGDYQKALAILQAVATTQGDAKVGLQAQVGLVVAYARSGEVQNAIALCETLTQSQNRQIQEWAMRSLHQLTLHHQNAKTPETDRVTGFVPFDNSLLILNQQQEMRETRETRETGRQGDRESNSSFTPSSPSSSSSNNQQPTTNNQQLTTNNQQPTTNNQQPTTNNQQLTTNNQQPTSPTSVSIVHLSSAIAKPLTIYWRQARRAKVWQPLHKLNLIPLRLLAAGTFFALFWVIRFLLVLAMTLINYILVKLPFLEPIQLLYSNPDSFVLLVQVISICFCPWLLDRLLTNFYGQRQLSLDTLNQHSREAVRLLQRCCQQQSWQLPKLAILPISAPVALTYGNLPRTARIVVSQGLLEQLADDEIATIYALQLGHIVHWDFVVMSLVLLFTIPAYRLYQQFSHWGDRTQKHLRFVMGIMACLAYGVWFLLTVPASWLSQLRLYYSDRLSNSITGNPNGLVRALLKIAIGIADRVQKEQEISWQLESLNILAPVGYQQSICLGSIVPHTTFESFLKWDYLNPYRWWFVINNTHPLMGDRLQRLSSVARNWHLDTELYLDSQQPLAVKRQSFFLQMAPFLGIPLGVVFAMAIWLVWQMAFFFKFLNLKWIYDNWSFATGCLLIGFSIGILIRINSFFPEIKSATVETNDHLCSLLANPAALPIDSVSVCLVGKLLGRRGTSNFLGQDLILQSSTGLVKLHYISMLGQPVFPQDWVGRQIIITGWLRRGATPWIDIQSLQTQSGKTINSPHPIWSTVLAVAAEAWGALILLKG